MLPSGPSYDALRAVGKPPKLALVAIMRRLLILANALLRAGRTWSPPIPA
jgi:transposase